MLLRNFSEVYNEGTETMSNLYNRIESLCKSNGISVTTMCKESGASRASLSDLRVGRKQSLSAETLLKIATYFGITVDYLLGNETDKAPAESGKRSISDDDIKAAFFNGAAPSITKEEMDAMWDDAKAFIQFKMEQRKRSSF